MKNYHGRLTTLKTRNICVGILVAVCVSCSASSAPTNPVPTFLSSLPSAELSDTLNNSIAVTVLHHSISNSVPFTVPYNWFIGNTITNEVRGLDPFYTYSLFSPYIPNITPTTISGGLQVNNGTYITDLTMLWENAQSQLYNYGSQCTETVTVNGSFKEQGNYSYINGNASISGNGNLITQFEDGDGSSGRDSSNYSASSNVNGFTPNSLIFSSNNTLRYNNSGAVHYSAASKLTDYTTGLKLQSENYNGWSSSNDNETGAPNTLTINLMGGIEYNGSASVLGLSVSNVTSRCGAAEIINMQIQFSSTSTIINGDETIGEIDEGGFPPALAVPVSPPLDFSGKVNLNFNNLAFVDSYCAGFGGGWWPWPTGGTITIISDHTYKYDFSINSTGNNCGCAVVSIDNALLNSGLPDCTIGSSQQLNYF